VKILHIVPLANDDAGYGGPVRNTFRQSEAQARLGHDVEVLSLWRGDGQPPTHKWGIRLYTSSYIKLPLHKLASMWSSRALTWLRQNATNYDVVHLHAGRDLWVLASALMLRRLGVPYVWQTHGMLAPRSAIHMRVYDAVLTRRAVSGAASIMYLTPYEERELLAFGGIRRSTLIVNGVDSPASEPPTATEDTELRIVFVSRLHERKRAVDLVNAGAALLSEGRQVQIDIFGPDEGALPELLRRIKELAVEDHVRYSGVLRYEDVRREIAKYNTFVLPSVNEPFPNALLEGLATGLACVCTTSCGLAPYIRDADAGLVIEPGTPTLADALRRLQDEPGIRKQFGMTALDLVRQQFAMPAIAAKMVSEYQHAIHEVRK
jgi:glycosyltransferase involved in cell wall biosynthesis